MEHQEIWEHSSTSMTIQDEDLRHLQEITMHQTMNQTTTIQKPIQIPTPTHDHHCDQIQKEIKMMKPQKTTKHQEQALSVSIPPVQNY